MTARMTTVQDGPNVQGWVMCDQIAHSLGTSSGNLISPVRTQVELQFYSGADAVTRHWVELMRSAMLRGQETMGTSFDNLFTTLPHSPLSQDITAGSYFIFRSHFSEPAEVEAELQLEFQRLTDEWKRDTAHLSSVSEIAQHRSYQAIIGMGKEAIPLILRDLESTHDHWFWALRSITRESPIRPEDRGDISAMTASWIDWGKRRHYI